MEKEAKSSFDHELACVMSGWCPGCGGGIIETCTNPEEHEWTITCDGCPFVMVFGVVKEP